MAIDFPNTPTTNQIYTVGSRSWKWDGTIWAIYSNNPVLYRQDSPPSSPQSGDQWFETDTGRMFVYYGTAWVELGNATDVAGALQPSQVTSLSAATTLTSDDVFPVVDNPSSAVASSKITYGNLVTNISASLAPGLVLIKTQTIGTAVSSVTVTDAFSADYDNYLITVSGGVGSTASFFKMTLGASVTGYYQVRNGLVYSTAARSDGIDNNAAAWTAVGTVSTNGLSMYLSINNPFLAKYTQQSGNYFSSTQAAIQVGEHQVATSYTSFTIAPFSGTVTGGTIRVYGYRNS